MNLLWITPEIFLSAAALLLFAGNIRRRRIAVGFTMMALVMAGILVLKFIYENGSVLETAAVDGMSAFFKLLLLAGMSLSLGLANDSAEMKEISWGTFCGVWLLSTVGLMMLAASLDLILVVVSLELIGISSFILTGFLKREKRSMEAAIKIFLVGALSSALFIYGISLVYGALGSTSLAALAGFSFQGPDRLCLVGGLLFVIAGLGFKLAVVPFHMWVPDTFEGAPTPVTAYLSVAPKIAALALLVRALPFHGAAGLSPLLAVLAVASMTLGNLAALRQTSVKRLLAYSSIAQMGYILLGFVAAGTLGLSSVLVYSAAYLFMNLGAFACLIAVSNESGSDRLESFDGLARRSFPLALLATVFLLSLTGIPPMLGFVAKFSVFAAAISERWFLLSVIGVLNSVVSLYYYFRIVHSMFFSEPSSSVPIRWSWGLSGCLVVSALITVLAGLWPAGLLAWVQQVVP
ncbi:MAG TPA: NADH-quinone oxidoreductase subunit N [Elusimicrobiota bacterium]|nr:NADH-quinone oxidoreductase subunit N [Elusimicrobiota bacterium]